MCFLQKIILLVFLFVANHLVGSSLAKSNFPGEEQRVVGGVYQERNEFTFLAEIQEVKENGLIHQCGASVYNIWTLITATHCVGNYVNTSVTPHEIKEEWMGKVYFTAGQYSKDHLDGTEQVRNASRIFFHPKYDGPNPWYGYDIAVVILDQPLEYNKNVQPIALASREEIEQSSVAIGMGWGRTSGCLRKQFALSTDLPKKEIMPLMPNSKCKGRYHDSKTDDLVCFGSPGIGLGPGDSGGPTVINTNKNGGSECLKLIGPNSYIQTHCFGQWGPTLANIAVVHAEWIASHAKGPPEGKC